MDDDIILSERDREIVRGVLLPFADRIERVAVFGSRANGKARPASDIDIALWGDVDDALRARLWSLFDRSSLAVSVDVVVYSPTLSVFMRHHIDVASRLLFSGADLRASATLAATR
ncbi:nucleotidyltransferase domain-containing protein [Sphingomonas sp.]|uniref:nucleotidyltransferase domain-containing protein n=1 Tax=Sphingomonas sp. TaxID=28214 RepID=UPI0035BBC657